MFGLDDLVPTTPGLGKAVEDIVANKNKSAMDSLALENALLKAHADQQRSQLNDQYMPIILAAQARKELQGVNVLPGATGIDPTNLDDPFWVSQVTSDAATKIATDEASAKALAAKTNLVEGNKMTINSTKEQNDLKLATNKAAEDLAKDLIQGIGRIPVNPSRAKLDKIHAAALALSAYPGTPAYISFMRVHGKYLPPGLAPTGQQQPQTPEPAFWDGQPPKAPQQLPPERTIKDKSTGKIRKFRLKANGKYEEVK